MTNPYRDMCAELTTAFECVYDGRRPKVVQELIDRALALLDQPEPEELTDEELLRTYGLAKRDHCYEGDLDDWPKKAERAATLAGLRAAIAADRARRATPQPESLPTHDLSSSAPLLWLLWNHQGSRSPVGLPIRDYLGMGQFESMSDAQIEAANQLYRQAIDF